MGIVDVKWRVAMSSVGQNFTAIEHDAGWPERFTHLQLAALQYPYTSGDGPAKILASSRAGDILNACQAGEIQSSIKSRQGWKKVSNRVPSGTSFVTGKVAFQVQSSSEATDVQVTIIDAAAFSAWLDAHGEGPSVHIAAWFDAVLHRQNPPEVAPSLPVRNMDHSALLSIGSTHGGVSMGPPLNGYGIFSLQDAIKEANRQLDLDFSEQEFLNFAAWNSVALFAVAPETAIVSVRDLEPGIPFQEKSRRVPGAVTLGVLYPPQLKTLLVRGKVDCQLPVMHDEIEGEFRVFLEPFTAKREDLRVGPDSLRKFVKSVMLVQGGYPNFSYRLPDRMWKKLESVVASAQPSAQNLIPVNEVKAPAPLWTGKKLAAQQDIFKADGHKDYAKRTWAHAGVKERDGRRMVSEYKATLQPAATRNSVFHSSGSTPKRVHKKSG
jgi:hypothetical protein